MLSDFKELVVYLFLIFSIEKRMWFIIKYIHQDASFLVFFFGGGGLRGSCITKIKQDGFNGIKHFMNVIY